MNATGTTTPATFDGGVNNSNMLTTINPIPNNVIFDKCPINIRPVQHLDLLDFIVGVYFILGFYYMFYGYRYFRTSMFFTGFSFASNIVYLICTSGEYFPELGNKIISACAGFLFGLITMLIQFVGLFVSGLTSGVLKGASILALYSNIFVTSYPTAYWISLVVCLFSGITSACLNVYCKKGLTIVSTSIYGGALVVMAIDYYIEKWAMVKWIFDRVVLKPTTEQGCVMWWILLGIWPFAFLIGMIVQTFLTGKGIHHVADLPALQRRSKAVPLTREQKAELRQRKYRYLYQVRTAHGDVISQSYLRALAQLTTTGEPWSSHGIGECSTLKSDSTHLTVLATEKDVQQDYSDTDEVHSVRVGA